MSAPSALLWVIASLLALSPLAGADSPAEALRRERKAAYRRGEFARVLDLVRRELAALDAEEHTLRRRCDALEAGVIVCSERLPELDCDDEFFQRAGAAGCLDDPRERARQHKLLAGAAFRRMRFAAALRASQRAVEAATPLLLASLLRADPPEQLRDVVLDLAGVAALRVEIAAQLRSQAGFEAALAALTLLLDVLEQDPATRADAALMRNVVAWGLLVLHEAGVDLGDPTPLLASALEVFTAEPTRDVPNADNTRINLALAALQRGASDEAARWLDDIEGAGLSVEERLWLCIARLRIALARGDLGEAARWQLELSRPELRDHAPMGAWFAAWTRGLLYEARGEPAAASAAYRDAEAELEAHARGSEAHADGSSADRRYLMFSGAARRLVDLRIADGDVEAALQVARNARNRALRLHARAACARAADTPPELPPPGALHLLYFPRDQISPARPSAWYGFAATAAGVRVAALTLDPLPDDPRRLSRADLQRWSDLLLAPFEPELTGADELTVFATGPLHALPLHALPWGGDLLLAAIPVQYGLDISPCREAPRDRLERALIASGSDYSLPIEGQAVGDLLRARGLAVDHWRAGPSPPLSAALTGQYELAHLAAHGQHPADEVMFAADVQLVFGDSIALTRESILALRSAPSLIYLSACRSSFADAETLGGGLNLAHAFLLRGARTVIGSVRDIDATVTRSFAAGFYRQLQSVDPADVARAWRAAYLDARAALAPSLQPDLRLLRLYTP